MIIHTKIGPLRRAFQEYWTIYKDIQKVLDKIQESDNPELKELIEQVKAKDNQLRDLMILQAQKNVPIDIGDQELSLLDQLDPETDSTNNQLRRKQAKVVARPLYKLCHPDKHEDRDLFALVRAAANAGELEILRYIRIGLLGEEPKAPDVDELVQLIRIRTMRVRSLPSFRIAQAYLSDNQDTFVALAGQTLKQRIFRLDAMILGVNEVRMPNCESSGDHQQGSAT